MDILGYSITVTKKAIPPPGLASVSSRGGWWPIIRESFAGAWQQNVEVSVTNVLTYSTVYACISLISSDVAKMRMRLVVQDDDGIWTETENPAYSPVLRKPNRYQIPIQFFESWMISKLVHGNTYVLKARDGAQIVRALYILDPTRVQPLVAPDGSVFYKLKRDDLSQQSENDLIVPASEIIHDRMMALYHPLVGLSPISACGLAATQGLAIQDKSTLFFENGSTPGGIVLVPGPIKQEQVDRLKEAWETNYGGDNQGKVAILSDNMKYEAIEVMSAVDSQLIEQLKWTAENVCTAFLVPQYKVGVGSQPLNNNVQTLNTEYFGGTIQRHSTSIENLLDEGLGISQKINGIQYGTEFDKDDLLMMDTAALISAEKEAVGAGIKAPNEARKRVNLRPKKGGDSPMIQQQWFSLEALAERDENKPFAKPTAAPAAPQADTASEKALLYMKTIERLRAA